MFSAAFKTLALVTGVAATSAVAASWKATLEPVAGSGISGESTVTPDNAMPLRDTTQRDTTQPPKADGVAMARITITGASANDSLPWHVHSGTCGSEDAPIVGSASDYAPIAIGANGEGSAHAKIATRLEPNGQYIVNVHKSATDLTVVSCGALKADGVMPDAE